MLWILGFVIACVVILLLVVYQNDRDGLQRSMLSMGGDAKGKVEDSLEAQIQLLSERLTQKETLLKDSRSKIAQAEQRIHNLQSSSNLVHDRYRAIMCDLKSELLKTETECKNLHEQITLISRRREDLRNEVIEGSPTSAGPSSRRPLCLCAPGNLVPYINLRPSTGPADCCISEYEDYQRRLGMMHDDVEVTVAKTRPGLLTRAFSTLRNLWTGDVPVVNGGTPAFDAHAVFLLRRLNARGEAINSSGVASKETEVGADAVVPRLLRQLDDVLAECEADEVETNEEERSATTEHMLLDCANYIVEAVSQSTSTDEFEVTTGFCGPCPECLAVGPPVIPRSRSSQRRWRDPDPHYVPACICDVTFENIASEIGNESTTDKTYLEELVPTSTTAEEEKDDCMTEEEHMFRHLMDCAERMRSHYDEIEVLLAKGGALATASWPPGRQNGEGYEKTSLQCLENTEKIRHKAENLIHDVMALAVDRALRGQTEIGGVTPGTPLRNILKNENALDERRADVVNTASSQETDLGDEHTRASTASNRPAALPPSHACLALLPVGVSPLAVMKELIRLHDKGII